MKVGAYLSFKGDAEKALNYYADIFEGKKDVVLRYDKRKKLKSREDYSNILYATLQVGNNILLFSDIPHGDPFLPGNTIMLRLEIESVSQLEEVFKRLLAEGKVLMPLQPMFFSNKCGMVRDKFGIEWLLSLVNKAV